LLTDQIVVIDLRLEKKKKQNKFDSRQNGTSVHVYARQQ